MKSFVSQRAVLGAFVLLLMLPPTPAFARVRHSEAWARERFAAAERMREGLNGRPAQERTRRDYQRVINNYRSVYLGAPTSTKADPSAVAAAEMLVEMGRRFDDDKILHSAIEQYHFLRREYPGSKYRFDALFTVGEIYKDDLDDPEQARAEFKEFLHRYPHNRLADDARQAIAELDQEATKAEREQSEKTEGSSKDDADKADSTQNSSAKYEESPVAASRRLPRVTGIRHWSTPDYTRVAIDIEQGVQFDSQRIDHPDRVFFDLHDTKLASTLVGKSFDVDDGLLKKIRVAQFQRGRTRVVLEVENLSEYNAFLLPDPYRLIIDIHGKDVHGKQGRKSTTGDETAVSEAASDERASAAADNEGATPKSVLPVAAKNDSAPAAKTAATTHTRKRPEAADDNDVTVWKLDGANNKAAASAPLAAPTAAPVKKIVEAEDDDDDAQVAKVDARSSPSKLSSDSDRADAIDEPNPSGSEVATHSRVRTRRSSRKSSSGSAAGASSERSSEKSVTEPAPLGAREAKPTASGDRSLIRALGLKIGKIVIDPGHGGHDTGTIGPNGLEEKDLVLDVGRRLGKLLEARLGAEVVYTRKDDAFIPLETRTAIANQERADLFISIHANSSHDPAARGVETYYLNFSSSPDALEVAARENAVSEKSIHELQDLVKKIALKEKIEESHEFASDVQRALHSGLAIKSPGVRDRGVKKAPFIVLIGANMPSILAEISFVSNPNDERRLETAEYRQRIAESLYRGIAKYASGLSGIKVASRMAKSDGQ